MNFRSLTAICLAFVLVLTGQSMAATRGAAPAVGQMVLCIGTESVTIYTDVTGAPTTAPHICSDCTLSLMLADAVAPLTLAAKLSRWVPTAERPQVIDAKQHLAAYLSRAPPALV